MSFAAIEELMGFHLVHTEVVEKDGALLRPLS